MRQKKDIIAKISHPLLPPVFHRTRLFELIDQCRRQPLLWISGLPGSGKTSLAAAYIGVKELSSLWYQVDRADNDPANFFYYMSEAVKKESRCGDDILPGLSPEHFMNLPYFAIRYFRKLFTLLEKPFIIVLDDYHEVPSDSELHELLAAGLDQVPSGVHVIVLSRTNPPPPLTRLLVNRKMALIPADELLLNADEAQGIAGLHDRWRSTPESVETLLAYTGGWTAGFVLMLESHRPADAGLRARGAARESFFNYFTGEIFNALEPEVRTFLLRLAHMPSFTPDEARELTGFAEAGAVLDAMNRKNAFLEKKVDNGTAYRFHPLFRDFLVSRAKEKIPRSELSTLNRRAADILVDHGEVEEAFFLYAGAGDPDAQANLIRMHARSFIARGRSRLVEEWLRALPRETLTADPWLLFRFGQCRSPFDPPAARDFFSRAADRFRTRKESTGLILSVAAVLETILIEWGDFRRMDPWIEELDRLLKERKGFPAPEMEAQAVFAMFSAMMFRCPHHPDMTLWEKRMAELFRYDRDVNRRLMVGGYLSHFAYWKGDHFQGERLVEAMVETMKTATVSPMAFLTVKMQEAVRGWHAADWAGCLEAVRQGLEESETSGVRLLDNWLLAQGVYAMLSQGDLGRAAAFLDRMKPILKTRRYLDIVHFYYLSSLYHLQAGNLETALRYSRDARRYIRDTGTPFPKGLNAITAAQIHFAMAAPEKAEQENNRAGEIGRNMGSRMLTMLFFLNRAYFDLKSDRECGGDELGAALTICKEQGGMNFPGWRSRMMTDICAAALATGTEKEFVRDLIRRRDLPPPRAAAGREEWPWPVRISCMGRFEVVIDGRPLCFPGKSPRKTLELLKALLALGGRGIGQGRLQNLLWPEADGDRARQALVTTLHRLRKLIGHEKALELSGMKLSLNDRYCRVDIWELDTIQAEMDEALADGRLDEKKNTSLTRRMLTLYRGDFLRDEDEHPWMLPTRTRLRGSFIRAASILARRWERPGTFKKAEDLYRRALAADETAEEMYRGLMRCCRDQGRTAEGLSVYNRCREVLAATLHVAPSAETESIHRALRQAGTCG